LEPVHEFGRRKRFWQKMQITEFAQRRRTRLLLVSLPLVVPDPLPAALVPGTGRDLVKALQADGLIESGATGAWSVTQAGRTFSVATAAKPVTRVTAEKALAQFLDRVEHVNRDPHFLGENILDGWLITGHRHQQILLPRPMWRSRNECRRLFGFEIAVSITARSSEL
jgi:hypothetical protein